MENVNHPERSQAELGHVMNDLQRGLDSASDLDMLIQDESGSDGAQALIQEIKGCFSRAMTTLNSSTQAGTEFLNPLDLPYATSQNTATQSNRRRRNRPRDEGTSASQEKLLLETPDDCYAWRIYRQKEIRNSIYPRLYYECAYKDDINCCATKTVRRLEHSSMYEIVYGGEHTCMQLSTEQYGQNSQSIINSSSGSSYPSTSDA